MQWGWAEPDTPHLFILRKGQALVAPGETEAQVLCAPQQGEGRVGSQTQA